MTHFKNPKIPSEWLEETSEERKYSARELKHLIAIGGSLLFMASSGERKQMLDRIALMRQGIAYQEGKI
jgi:hypothetical protein